MFSIDFNVFVLVAGIAVGAFGWQWIYARIAQAKVLAEAELAWVKAKLKSAEAKLASFMPASPVAVPAVPVVARVPLPVVPLVSCRNS